MHVFRCKTKSDYWLPYWMTLRSEIRKRMEEDAAGNTRQKLAVGWLYRNYQEKKRKHQETNARRLFVLVNEGNECHFKLR